VARNVSSATVSAAPIQRRERASL